MDAAGGNGSADGDDLAEQNSRLKEALRRLQSVHLSDKKAAEAKEEGLLKELAAIREEAERLADADQRVQELSIQLEISAEEMKDLAQARALLEWTVELPLTC
jgi:uncharacterized protein involved in exopolysaccharide biosynthesis